MRDSSQHQINHTNTVNTVIGGTAADESDEELAAGVRVDTSTYVGQVVFDALFDEDDCCGVARLEVVIVRAQSWDEAHVVLEEFGRARSGVSVEMPQGEGRLQFVGVRDIREVDASMPASGALLADFTLEIHGAGSGRRLVDREPVECMFDW